MQFRQLLENKEETISSTRKNISAIVSTEILLIPCKLCWFTGD